MENIKVIQLKYLDELYKFPTAPAEGTIFKIQETEQFYLISKDGIPLLIKGMTDEILENKKSLLSFSFGANSDGEEWAEPNIGILEDDMFATGLTVYDLNKNIMKYQTPLDDNELYEAAETILAFCEEQRNKYYMLLCHELRYFTLFNYYVQTDRPLPNIEEEVIGCANDIGSILSIEEVEGAIEIWIKTEEDEAFAMYFFPYDRGVIKCQ